MYDLIIIGGGPAGVSAAVYAGRKKIKTLVITEAFGGQSITSPDIQNWIGIPSVSGYDLAKNFEAHVRTQKDVEIKDGAKVKKVEEVGKKNNGKPVFKVETESGESFEALSILLTVGSHHKKLEVPREKELDGRGVVYCSTCDAPLFDGKVVAVVGGGNSALEAVRDLQPYASKIHLVHRRNEFRGDPVTLEKIKVDPRVEFATPFKIKEIQGENEVTGIVLTHAETNEEKELPLDGVFVEIGAVPNSDIVKGLCDINERGEVVVDHKTQRTSVTGIWAAGDVSDVMYKQNNISAGDGVKALLNIYDYLK